MKNIYFLKARAFLFAGSLFFGTSLSAQVFKISMGDVNASDVSNNGIVSLNSPSGNFIWSEESGIQTINEISNGYSNGGQAHISNDGSKIAATVTNPETDGNEMGLYDVELGTWTFLGGLGTIVDGEDASAWSISGDGSTVVGLGWTGGFGGHAIYWKEDEGIVDLGSTVEGMSSRANDANFDGSVIVGWQDAEDGFRQAAIWREGVQTLLYDEEGYELWEAGAISDDGNWIVGGDLGFSAWRWSEETGVLALDHPQQGPYFRGAATGISQDGSMIIGYYRPWPGPAYFGEGFIWTEDLGVVNLNDYVDSLGMDRDGISFTLPLGISANGKYIVGNGLDFEDNIIAFMINLENEMGVKDLNSSTLTYYPNPVGNILHIDSKKEIKSIEVYNLSGQKVLLNSQINQKKMDVTKLLIGTYVFKITFENGQIETFKIIKK